MPERYLQHVTLNTGDIVAQPRSAIDGSVIEMLRPLLERAAQGELVQMPGEIDAYSLNLTPAGDCCAVTLWYADEVAILTTAPVPLLTIGIAAGECGTGLWQRMHTWMPEHGITDWRTDPERPPELPWCGDILEPRAEEHMDALRWSGDFARSVAWTWVLMREAAKNLRQ